MRPFLFLSLAATILSTPLENENFRQSADAIAPTVTIANGTIIGSGDLVMESFKGIPFAEPPVGKLRLKPPQPLTRGFGTFVSQTTPASCPQFLSQIDKSNLPSSVVGLLLNTPFFQTVSKQSEDCLSINVQRPSGTTGRSKLPVVVYFFGGAFEFGNTQLYDGGSMIKKSIHLGQQVIFVAVNSRISGFGFLAGKELQEDGSTNLGLKDQRRWIQDNIAAFGGDPSKVTLWGESAGSISAFDHTIINGGNNAYNGKPLFRGVIMDSGAMIPVLPVDDPKSQLIYDAVVDAAFCPRGPNSLKCLRLAPYKVFLNAVNSVPAFFSYSAVNLAYLPRPDPSDDFFPVSPDVAVLNGNFTKVPIIIGDQEDEGTLFSLFQRNITTTSKVIDYFHSYFPLASRKNITDLVATYPDDPRAGSPFGTGLLNEVYPQFKRIAAILGDITFTLNRRVYLSIVSSQIDSWSYLSSYLYGTPILGTFHASDVLQTFFDLPSAAVSTNIQNYYISFINNLDPNGAPNQLTWPKYNNDSRPLMNFRDYGLLPVDTIIPDTFRQASFKALKSTMQVLKV
ncbi:lipase 3 precursor [Venturia nashicola]|uniref:Carboxylic ester hydrolase n=1 Tax=Venturia nashicola TaxID=86259 RepID=A0A4Z1PDB4_9PEZI|nr:lipase 3 precursor [Venturia nashicola]TLD38470.1 lipase 3 precursor [Venturia nashicola]